MISDRELTSSLEDYLEAILILETKNRVARVKEIAEMLNVRMPSVSGALKNLKSKNLINYEKNSFISLTDEGMAIAKVVKNKHKTLKRFFSLVLNLSEEEADDHACRIEHDISTEAASRIGNLTEYISKQLKTESDTIPESWNNMITGTSE